MLPYALPVNEPMDSRPVLRLDLSSESSNNFIWRTWLIPLCSCLCDETSLNGLQLLKNYNTDELFIKKNAPLHQWAKKTFQDLSGFQPFSLQIRQLVDCLDVRQ
jgi:hypothetical protein